MLFASCNSRFGNEVSVLQNTKRDAAIDRGCELPSFEMSSFAAVCDSVQKEVVGQAILSFGMLRLSVLDTARDRAGAATEAELFVPLEVAH